MQTGLIRTYINKIEACVGVPAGNAGLRTRLAFYYLLAGGLTFATYVPVFYFLQNWILMGGMILGSLACLIGLHFIYRSDVRMAAIIAVSVGFVMVNFNSIFVGGAFAVGDLFLIPTTIIGWVIFGHRIGLRLAVLSIICTILHLSYFLILGNSYDLPLNYGGSAHAFLVAAFKISLQVIIYTLIFLFSYFMNRTLNEIQSLNASITAMLHTDLETAIAIFDAEYQLIDGSTSDYFRELFISTQLIELIDECQFPNGSLIKDIFNIAQKQDQLTWLLNSASLPSLAIIDGKRHKLEWKSIFAKGKLDRVIFMAHSIEELWQAKHEAETKTEEAHRFLHLVSLGSERVIDFVDRSVIQLAEAKRCLSTRDIRHSYIALHTFKGSSRMLGFTSLSEKIHQLESHLATADIADFKEVDSEFDKILRSCRALGYSHDALILSREQAKKAIASQNAEEYLKDLIYPTLNKIILSYQSDVEKLANNLTRPSPLIHLPSKHRPIHITQAAKQSLHQSLIHIFRNTLDHSIEPIEIRKSLNKPIKPTLTVNIREMPEGVELAFSDDGQGLDINRIKSKASSLGYPTAQMSEHEIAEIIFKPGFSTVETTTEISGRGVGMDAIRTAMERIGGEARLKLLEKRGDLFSWELLLLLPTREYLNELS